jgi:predicted GNAT superfamily acetyltransferase
MFRDVTASDLATIHAINEAEVPAVGSVTIEGLAHIADQSTVALVAELDDEIAGFCLVLPPGADYGSSNYRWFSERYDDFVYLDRVAVAPRFRRRGVGRGLYAEVERRVRVRHPDHRHFTLEVNLRPRNDRSLAFHAELGFDEVGRQETDYGALVSMMVKPL